MLAAFACAGALAGPRGNYQVVDDFDGQPNAGPNSELVAAPDGRFYGTTIRGGQHGLGSVYAIDAAGSSRTVYSFGRVHGPEGVTVGPDGQLYGVTTSTGDREVASVFRLAWNGTLTILRELDPAVEGYQPTPLVVGTDGALYGTTVLGGAGQDGTLYRITTAGESSVVHAFDAVTEGYSAMGTLLALADGSFVGTMGDDFAQHGGNVYRVAGDGSFSIVAAFGQGGEGPCTPSAGVIDGHDGWLYGTSHGCGASKQGTLYRTTLAGQVEVMHSFRGEPHDGSAPVNRLCLASDGALYGVAPFGGASNRGVAYRVDRNGAYAVLYDFRPALGSGPMSGLIQAGPRGLLGTTPIYGPAGNNGVVFLLSAP